MHKEACQTRKNLIELNFPPMSMLTTETNLDACQKKRRSVLRMHEVLHVETKNLKWPITVRQNYDLLPVDRKVG